MVATNGGKKAVVIPHSMGVLYFLHFMKWVEAPAPMGGGGGPDWCSKHIKAVVNIGGPFLGVPKAIAGLFSAEAKDIAVARYLTSIPSQKQIVLAIRQVSYDGLSRISLHLFRAITLEFAHCGENVKGFIKY